MDWKKNFLVLAIIPLALWARTGEPIPEPPIPDKFEPWFTGPLLTPSGNVIPLSHQNIEPYIYYNRNVGLFNHHWKSHSAPTYTNVLTQISLQFGVLPRVELDLNPTFSYNHTQSKQMWVVNDTPVAVGFQLITEDLKGWTPSIKMRWGLNLPTGRYDELNPKKLGVDAGGLGAWYPNFGFVVSKLFHIYHHHYLAWRQSLVYTWGTSVHVHGLSVYGGSPSIGHLPRTNGTVYPGNSFNSITGFEYSLSQNWVVALDIFYESISHQRFRGYSPLNTKPTHPSQQQLSLAPAIEYNFSPNVGIIVGPWFSVAGRNTLDYYNWVLAINVYH